ncbi:MAG: 4Fe-4S dicluster domain-containing protein [Alphaproteobacteria bacterium]|nr:4Fe-4S dicluster domain-containing protein [Alphaproteobacteria bacterium]
MPAAKRKIFVCSCEKTMPVDGDALARVLEGEIISGNQLCGSELDRVRRGLESPGEVLIACTYQAPLFSEVAEELRPDEPPLFANIREMAGWSAQAQAATPKMAALLAAAAEPMPPVQVTTLESKGVALIYGADESAIEAGRKLAGQLDITVVLTPGAQAAPLLNGEFPVFCGKVRNAKGWLGAYDITIDGFAIPAPSSRGQLKFGAARDGATSHCDVLIDLSGGQPLFPGTDLRAGYLRADPRDRAAMERVLTAAAQLSGAFDKPRYIDFRAELCAHSRSNITGCTRCIDLCPAGAITPGGDHVSISAEICAGCGSCAAACPTGAASYALPPADALMRRMRAMLNAYHAAGGTGAALLLHDGEHGEELIAALARFGDGLPAHVIPLRVNEITQVGPETIAAAFAWGAGGLHLLARQKPKHDLANAHRIVETANRILAGLGFGQSLVSVIETDDPDALGARLAAAPLAVKIKQVAGFDARGGKRGLLETAFRELHRAAPAPVSVIALDKGAPFGGVTLDTAGCTLCHACVTACPTGALSDYPDKPMLRFSESLCVQCGLCQSTCPEKVIRIEPRVDFDAWQAGVKTLKEEEPYPCVKCGKPFGARASVERVVTKLQEKHWMFSGANQGRIDLIRMCEDCRTETVINEGFDPHAAPQRPPVMTTEDYIKARERNGKDLLN